MEAYRLLWLPSYGPALMVIASRADGNWTLEGVEYARKDSAQLAGWLAGRRTEPRVSIEEITPMLDALRRGGFWTTSFFQAGGEDGERWTLEGRLGQRYRAVTRWSDEDIELTSAARTLIQLSGLDLPQRLRARP